MWAKNVTNIEAGKFRTINGNADELIGIGRVIKAGFSCSKVEITNGRYDAVIDLGHGDLLRVQIKGSSDGNLALTGGGRSGEQINRDIKQRIYKYSKEDCDLILGVDSNTGDCYLLPIEDVSQFGSVVKFTRLEKYRENWELLKNLSPAGQPDTEVVALSRK